MHVNGPSQHTEATKSDAMSDGGQPQAGKPCAGRTQRRRWRHTVTFLKKGIRFSFARGDMTVFGLALGERWLAGSSLSSGSKPVASMSMATHTYTHTDKATVTHGRPQSPTGHKGNSNKAKLGTVTLVITHTK